MTPREAVRSVEKELGGAGVPSPRVDAEYLVAHALGLSRADVYLLDGDLSEAQLVALREITARRVRREPLAYILGDWGFRRLILGVDRRVLVPRPETEIVVERCLELVRGLHAPRVVDVGTGSGAIALAIADEHPGAHVLGIDSSDDALAVARANAERAGLADSVTFERGDLISSLAGPVDLVASNPPYVRERELRLVDPEVRDWEPRSALIGEGIAERLAADALRVLRPDGALVLECGDGQASDLAETLRRLGYAEVLVTRDLAGVERVVEGRAA